MKVFLFKLEVSVEGNNATDYVVSLGTKLGQIEEEYLKASHPNVQIHKIEIVSSCQVMASVETQIKEDLSKLAEHRHLIDKGATIEVETNDIWICKACGSISEASPCGNCDSTNGAPYSSRLLNEEPGH